MEIIDIIISTIIIQPVYNLLFWLTGQVANQAGLAVLLLGSLFSAFFIPTVVANHFDSLRTRKLRQKIEQIQLEVSDPQIQQERILQLLRRKQILFKSESVYLFGLAVGCAILYPTLMGHWPTVEADLLYSQAKSLPSVATIFWGVDLSQSSPAISLLPALLLFVELKLSYREQQFLTNFIDRWYPLILPLFVYFLIFWLPVSMSLFLSGALLTTLYLRFLLLTFARRRGARSSRSASASE